MGRCDEAHRGVMSSMPPPRLLVPALAVHLVVVTLAWRDIARRTPAQLRGSKALWRVITALNAGVVPVDLAAVARLQELELIVHSPGRLRVTEAGALLLDAILPEIVTA